MTDDAHTIRTAPQGQSILWRPTEGAAADEAARQIPIYIKQRALAALHDHMRTASGQGILGFLVGDLCSDPGTTEKWLDVSLVVRLTQAIYGDKTTLVISRVWERLEQEVSRTGGHMLGWYHSHPEGGVALEANDLEAHEQYFPRPWQTALVVGQSGERAFLGAFYRPAGQPLAVRGILPFYEVVDPESITAEGKKRTRVTWKNYKPDTRRSGTAAQLTGMLQPIKPSEQVAPTFTPAAAAPPAAAKPPAAKAPAAPPPKPAAPPEALPPLPPTPAGLPSLEPPPKRAPMPAPAPRVSGRQRAVTPPPDIRGSRPSAAARKPFAPMLQPQRTSRLPLVLGLLVLVAGAGAGYWFWLRPRLAQAPAPTQTATADGVPQAPAAGVDSAASDTGAGGPAATPTAAPAIAAPVVDPMQQFDRVTDSLDAALRRYQDRARRFDNGNRDCPALGRSLVAVDEQWLVYSSERRGLTAPLDAARVGRDLELYAQVDSVQGHFDRSGCSRP